MDLLRAGRFEGALVVALSGLAVVLLWPDDRSNAVILVISALAFAACGMLAIRYAPRAPQLAMPKAALVEKVMAAQTPFTVCSRCNAFFPDLLVGCGRCGSFTHAVQVANERDRSMARAAVE